MPRREPVRAGAELIVRLTIVRALHKQERLF